MREWRKIAAYRQLIDEQMGGSIVKYSRLLQKGDTIGICTPFTGASGDVLSTRLNNVISNI